jgi:hypothetical protein
MRRLGRLRLIVRPRTRTGNKEERENECRALVLRIVRPTPGLLVLGKVFP